jgi:ABC-type nitrate/sulfonate/bicarbonate transport system permease component
MRKRLPTFLSVALLLLMWQLVAMYIGYPALFPPLPDLLQNIASLFVLPDFYASIGATIGRGMVGFVISFITAFICALLSSNSGFWKDFFHPILVVTQKL